MKIMFADEVESLGLGVADFLESLEKIDTFQKSRKTRTLKFYRIISILYPSKIY